MYLYLQIKIPAFHMHACGTGWLVLSYDQSAPLAESLLDTNMNVFVWEWEGALALCCKSYFESNTNNRQGKEEEEG